jgi:hypothetical protein
MSAPIFFFNISIVRVGDVPSPEEPKEYFAGSFFAASISLGSVWESRIAGQQVRLRADPCHGLEVGQRVVARLGIEVRHQRVAADVAEEHRIAVGRRLGHVVRGDRPAGAGAILDHEGLARIVAELGAEPTRDIVLRTARRERADDANRLVRPVVALRLNALCERQRADGGQQRTSFHTFPPNSP